MPPTVSIITVYYNTPDDLLELYASLQQSLNPGEWEWIVADNHSSVDLSSRLIGVKYLRLDQNLGFGKANNYAAQYAAAPYLFFLNPDCLVFENVLPPLLEAMKTCAIAGPKVVNADGTVQLSFGPFLSVLREARQKFLTRSEKSHLIQKWLQKKTRQNFSPDYVSGCALMIGSELFRDLGGFDEQFFLYEEDVDLCKRVRNRGLHVCYVPTVAVQHARNRSTQHLSGKVKKEYRHSQLHYYKKHNSRFQQILLKVYLTLIGNS